MNTIHPNFMKYIFCFFLTLLISGSLWASGIKAGYAQVEITPKVGDELMMVGGGSGIVKSIGSPLYARAVILSDGKHEAVLISVDLIDLRESDFQIIKNQLEKSFDHVVIAVTHTHGGFFGDQLLDKVLPEILKCVKLAKSTMKPVKIGANSTLVDEAYNRRILNVDGVEMLWSNPDRKPNRPVDQSLGIIHMIDEKGNPFITMLNYSAHPVITMDLNNAIVSSDYPGELRREIEERVGGHAIFFMGASGDVNPYHANTLPFEAAQIKSKEMGINLATAAHKAIEQIDEYQGKGNFKFDNVLFKDPEAAVSILLLTPDISISGFPGEYFDELGRTFKENNPTQYSFFIGKSNGDLRYVPTVNDTELGGFGADTTVIRVKNNTGETHIQTALKHLEALKKQY